MPTRNGFGSGLQRGLHGAFGGAEDVLGSYMKQQQQRQAADEQSKRELERQKQLFQFEHPPETPDSVTEKMLGTIQKASAPQEVPTPTMVDQEARAHNLPMRFGLTTPNPLADAPPPAPEADVLPSTPMAPTSPAVNVLRQAISEKRGQFPPTPQEAYDPATDTTTKSFVSSWPSDLRAQPPVQTKPTGAQLGASEGAQAQAAAPGKGAAEAAIEDIVRPGKVQTAGATTTANATAKLAVDSSPQAMKFAADTERMKLSVRQAFVDQNLPPNFADNFIKDTPFGSYLFIPPNVSAEERMAITRGAYTGAAKAGTKLPLLAEPEANSMELVSRAAANYRTLVEQIAGFAPKTAAGRLFGGPANVTVGQILQANPQLAAMQGAFASEMEIAGAQMTGVRGARLGQQFIQAVRQSSPQPTDTLPALRQKQLLMDKLLGNVADSIIGRR